MIMSSVQVGQIKEEQYVQTYKYKIEGESSYKGYTIIQTED